MKAITTAVFCAAASFALSACNGEGPHEAAAAPEAAKPTAPLMMKGDGPAGPGEPTLEEVKQLTEKYQDVKVALAAGYIRDPFDLCDNAELMGKPASDGAMGVHYFRPDLAGVTAPPNPRVDGNGMNTDFRNPTVLIYEPQADDSLKLVAVENLVFQKAWKDAGHTSPPTFHGVAYDAMQDDPATPLDEGHMFAPHYDRHVWIYRENPNGVFTPFNPAVSCANHKGAKMPPMPGMAKP